LLCLTAAAIGCATAAPPGKALLPDGIEDAKVPGVDGRGYLYFSADPPLALSAQTLLPPRQQAQPNALPIKLQRATMVIGASLEHYAGILEFASDEDAQAAWELFAANTDPKQVWAKLSPPRMLLSGLGDPWGESAQASLNSDELVLLSEHDPVSWGLLTNLPADPPSRPVAAGVVKLEGGVLERFGSQAGLALEGLSDAFGLVRVDTVGFGVYSDSPIEVPARIDDAYLRDSRASVLFVTQSGYSGGLVAFMLSVVAGRNQMELIELGDTNARYRAIGGLHLVLKNRGSLVFAALAGSRAAAEELMLSALAE